jgi:hypothetical protein
MRISYRKLERNRLFGEPRRRWMTLRYNEKAG